MTILNFKKVANLKILDTLLKQVFNIWYKIQFQSNKVRVLINTNNKVNIITLTYRIKLNLFITLIGFNIYKNNNLSLQTYRIVLVRFSIMMKFWNKRLIFERYFFIDQHKYKYSSRHAIFFHQQC